jgi:hypothetical protein
MVDIADYTNESTRDYEMRQIIKDVQVHYFVHNIFHFKNKILMEFARVLGEYF